MGKIKLKYSYKYLQEDINYESIFGCDGGDYPEEDRLIIIIGTLILEYIELVLGTTNIEEENPQEGSLIKLINDEIEDSIIRYFNLKNQIKKSFPKDFNNKNNYAVKLIWNEEVPDYISSGWRYLLFKEALITEYIYIKAEDTGIDFLGIEDKIRDKYKLSCLKKSTGRPEKYPAGFKEAIESHKRRKENVFKDDAYKHLKKQFEERAIKSVRKAHNLPKEFTNEKIREEYADEIVIIIRKRLSDLYSPKK